MKLNKYIACLLAGSIMASCNNFEEINTNPDSATKVTASILATGAIMGIMKQSTAKPFVVHQFYTKHLGWAEGFEGAQYNSFGRENFSGYTALKDYNLMVEVANEQDKNAYEGLALFLKAYKLFNYTLNVGDIPYEGILEGAQGNLTPKYNTQKDVFKFLITDLDRAYELMSSASEFSGDPIFSGNTEKWAKVITALELRVLINLSKKENDTDLDVKSKFADVVARNNLMTSNDDNLQLVFSEKDGQLYPFNHSQNKYTQYPIVSNTVIDILQANKDYRLFYYAAPSGAKLKEGLAVNDWDAYPGIDPSRPVDELKQVLNEKTHCSLNDRYMYYSKGEPFIIIGYAEQNFILAEAALRGWIPDPDKYYKKAIEGSMRFAADNTPDNADYHHNRMITDEVIAQTLANPTIQLNGNFDTDLKKIIEQKYVAGFMQLPYQTYYDYRRTGYPVLPINPETNMNHDAPTKMPVRWLYPTTEFDYNKENVEEAIQRQFAGDDDVNAIMWLLQ